MFVRFCPLCGGAREYKRQDLLDRANKQNAPCMSCAVKASHARDPNRFKGENNPMFGKSALETMSDEDKHRLFSERSARVKGENNPMFGKPAPLKSGRGVSGTYKGLHFRSLLELAFILRFEADTGVLPRSAECSAFRVIMGPNSYFPDFTDGNMIFEIKPKRLLNWGNNPKKFAAAREKFGDKFVVITEDLLPNYRRLQVDDIKGVVLHKRGKKQIPNDQDV